MKKEKEENIWSKVEVQNGVEKGVKFKVEENIWSPEKKNKGKENIWFPEEKNNGEGKGGKYLFCAREEKQRRKNLIDEKYLVNRGKGVMALGREFAI